MKTLTFPHRLTLVFLAFAFFLGSCSSTTLIQSVPSGAKVFVDGESAGYTPYKYTDEKIIFSKTNLVLEKEGYEPLSVTLIRNEEADVGAIIGGFFFWPFWLWALKYKAIHSYELKPAN